MLRKILVITFSILALYYVFLFDSISPALIMLFKLLPMLLLIGIALTTPSPTPYKRKRQIAPTCFPGGAIVMLSM